MQAADPFDITIDQLSINVTPYFISGTEMFLFVFSDTRPALIITQGYAANGPLWTSVPPGRQQEAVYFGSFIDKELKK